MARKSKSAKPAATPLDLLTVEVPTTPTPTPTTDTPTPTPTVEGPGYEALPIEGKVAALDAVAAPNAAFSDREAWLNRACEVLRPWLASRGYALHAPYVSVGFPLGSLKAIGQAWTGARSADGRGHIFISPVLADPVRVLDVLLHELGHEVVGVEHGHRKPFSEFCRRVGLVKPWTATTASPALAAYLRQVADLLGPYPHAHLDPTKTKRKPQANRSRRYECPGCGQKLRAGTDDLQAICTPCDEEFVLVSAE